MQKSKLLRGCFLLGLAVSFASNRCLAGDAAAIDTLSVGAADSETTHALAADHSQIAKGGFDQPCRQILPLDPPQAEGGRLSFTMKCDPEKQTYFTVKLWGSDHGSKQGRLYLFCQGKQVGWRHLGEVDPISIGTDEPALLGRFIYKTLPLPLTMTRGKQSVDVQLRLSGPIWGYGTTYEQYQKPQTEISRGIYRVYTHTDPCFVPAVDEAQGAAPVNAPVRKGPDEEVVEQIKDRVNRAIDGMLISNKPLTQSDARILARAYHVKWSHAFQNDAAVKQVMASIDNLSTGKTAVASEPNPDWIGMGTAGNAAAELAEQFKPALDEKIDDGHGGQIVRRAAWSKLFADSRDVGRAHRRQYTNQAMILDMNVYLANRAVEAIDPEHALPEEQCLHYLHQAIGIEPWLGSDTPDGPAKPLGENHYLVTRKGLTRELGYVGNYGEILDWVTHIYKATQIGGRPGDEKIKTQLEKLAQARSYFRYPALDAEGNRAMRLETVVGWRDSDYPGEVVYGERSAWEGSASYCAAALQDEKSIGHMHQMMADNQYFKSLEELNKTTGSRVTTSMLGVPDQYQTVKSAKASNAKLPMTTGQPDFAWADEEDGVLAVKHGDEVLYVSLYWRARYGINNWARVHHITPTMERIAVAREETKFNDSGETYTVPDWVDMAFGKGYTPPGDIHQAFAGEKLAIVAAPAGVKQPRAGQESPYAGKASFYTLRYGNYLIAMNCTSDQTFDLPAGGKAAQANDLVSGKTIALSGAKVGPMSTMVLLVGQ